MSNIIWNVEENQKPEEIVDMDEILEIAESTVIIEENEDDGTEEKTNDEVGDVDNPDE